MITGPRRKGVPASTILISSVSHLPGRTASPSAHDRRGTRVPDDEQPRTHVDEDLVRRAAAVLREDPARGRSAGLACDTDAYALATLLEILAPELDHLDVDQREKMVADCRQLLGQPAPSPPR
jgi:hypothetical protein